MHVNAVCTDCDNASAQKAVASAELFALKAVQQSFASDVKGDVAYHEGCRTNPREEVYGNIL